MNSKPLFCIVDLMPFLYRGHFVFLKSPRMTADGVNTSALNGLANGLAALLSKHVPAYLAIAADPGGPTFRHEAYPPYKAQRAKMPEDIAAAIPQAMEFASAMRIPVVRVDGFEADDVMGTLAKRAAGAGFEVMLVTPDKDAAQLVGPGISLVRPAHGTDGPEVYDEKRVCEHWSISSPAQMVDYLALAGDASDNIPGIKGVGEKTAISLLSKYGTVEGIVEHAAEIPGKLGEKIAAGAEDAKISKFLAAIRTDAPVDAGLETFKRVPHDSEALARFCARYELNRIYARLTGGEEPPAPAEKTYKTIADVPHDYRLVQTPEEARELAKELMRFGRIAFDTETSGLSPRTDVLAGISFATEPGRAWYAAVPRHSRFSGADAGKPRTAPADDLFSFAAAAASPAAEEDSAAARARDFVRIFAPVFADPSKILVAQNSKFDIAILKRYGIEFGSAPHDTMLEHYTLDAAARHDMTNLSREFLGYDPVPIEKLIGAPKRGVKQRLMTELAPVEVLDYAAEDADVTLRLDGVLRPKVRECGLEKILEESEEPLAEVLADMESEGVRIDPAALRAYGRELDGEIASIAANVRAIAADESLNLDSPRQLGEFLFGKLALGAGSAKKTSGGQYATDEATLVKYAAEAPVVRMILDYRELAKLKSTYAEKLPACIDPADGRVHTNFSQASTGTGRLASSGPNLQNIPVRSERGRHIRAAFIPRDAGHLLVSADYSQIELRIMAAMARDESMLAAFAAGEDIHRETAARVFGVPPEEVTAQQRSRCKMVNFGIIYGISAFGLSQRLGIPRREAAALIDTYFREYPRIKEFMEKAVADARAKGYAETLSGRRRTLRDIVSRNAPARQAAERDAINTPVQGTAADLMKIAMVKVSRALKASGMKTKLVLQIHDELLFDAPAEEAAAAGELARREMSGAMDLGVPLEVSVGTGANWLEAH